MHKYPKKIYAIQHNKTGKIYVGSTKNLDTRITDHMRSLRRGTHPNTSMQEDFNKYGDDYKVFILDNMEHYGERSKEVEWMRKLKTYDPAIGYNENDPAFTSTMNNIEIIEGVPIPNGGRNDEDEH